MEAPGSATTLCHYPQPWLKDVDEEARQMPNVASYASQNKGD